MGIINWFKKLLPSAEGLPDIPPPKAPSGSLRTTPAYLGSGKGTSISNAASDTTNLVLSDYARNEGSINATIKKLVLTSPDLSNAVSTKIASAVSKHYTVIATDPTGRVDIKGTELVQSFIQRLNFGAYDYSGFTRSTDLRTLTATMLFDSFRYGAMGMELVLGKTRFPAYFKPFSVRAIKWADNTPNTYPIYTGPTEDIHLNYPTIFYSSTIQDSESAYASSPLQTAIQACLWDSDFADTLRRAATKNLLQRLQVVINSDKFLATLPIEVKTDTKKQQEYMDALVAKLEDQLANLDPEDSLVLFDIMEADTIADANRSEDRSIDVLQALINGRVSSGAKILPSIIGRGQSSTAASTESMLFLKAIASSQLEFNIMMSRALTLAMRLTGADIYVEFNLEEVNLRPSLELESFKALRQSTKLEQLSLGLISDERCAIDLTGKLPPHGYKPLCGTMFKYAAADPSGNDYSNTSVSNDGKTDSTQAQKSSEADTPGVKSK